MILLLIVVAVVVVVVIYSHVESRSVREQELAESTLSYVEQLKRR